MKPLSEAEVKEKIRNLLNFHGIFHFPVIMSMYGRKGVADIVGCYNTTFFAVEVKRSDWTPPKPTAKKAYAHYLKQKKFLEECRAAGGTAFFATNIEIVAEMLKIKIPGR